MTVTCFGILVADVFLPPLAHFPRPGELMVTEDFLFQPGGCAANTARDLSRLGVASAVRGTVGADVFGDLVKSQLGHEGIDVTGVARTDEIGTSKTVILDVPGEDRRYIHTIGANAAVRAADLDGVAFSDGDVLYVGGYLVLPGLDPEGLAARLAAAQQAGARTVLDVCVPADGEVRFEDVAPLLPYVDLFVPNEDEARVLSGAEEASLQAEVFLSAGAGAVVVTRGAAGALMAAGKVRAELRAPGVEVVDGSGAGDAFAAGFICGFVEGWPLERSFAFATAVGASACTALGCTAGVFSRQQAEDFVIGHSLAPA
jgi:sugar/nucleoside kinase (ribokinase family)